MAVEVEKLGVIGAGQMAGLLTSDIGSLIANVEFHEGPGHRLSSCSKSSSASQSSRQFISSVG